MNTLRAPVRLLWLAVLLAGCEEQSSPFGTSVLAGVTTPAPVAVRYSGASCPLLPALTPVRSVMQLAEDRGGLKIALPFFRWPDTIGNTGPAYFSLDQDGTFRFRAEALNFHYLFTCQGSKVEASGDTVRASCEFGKQCEHYVYLDGRFSESEISDGIRRCREDESEKPLGTQHFLFRVAAVSDTYWRAQVAWEAAPPRETAVRTFLAPKPGSDEPAELPYDPPFTLQIIPGATDRALHEAVSSELQRELTNTRCALLFEGQPAARPRKVTEVYAVGDAHRQEAAAIARRLEPITGPVAVKAWPGDWPYDVVVVTGERKAP